jgi:hypothetical protein
MDMPLTQMGRQEMHTEISVVIHFTCSFQNSLQIFWVNYATFPSVEFDSTLFLFVNILLHLNEPSTFRGVVFVVVVPSRHSSVVLLAVVGCTLLHMCQNYFNAYQFWRSYLQFTSIILDISLLFSSITFTHY